MDKRIKVIICAAAAYMLLSMMAADHDNNKLPVVEPRVTTMAARTLFSSRLAGLYREKVVPTGRRAYSIAAAAVARKQPVEVTGKARLPGAADKLAAKPKEEMKCHSRSSPLSARNHYPRRTMSTGGGGDVRLSIEHQTRFALRLTAALCSPSSSPSSNVVFSPLSLHVVLSLLAAGAGGATRDHLLAALGGGDGPAAADNLHALTEQVAQLVLADGSEVGGPRVAFADAVFVDSLLKLKPAFDEVAVGKYKAEVHSIDFQKKAAQVAGQVNSWVEKSTSGLIKEILPPGSVDETTRLVLGNALYFKGAWTEKFDASKTSYSEFHLLDGSSVQAPFMSSREDQYVASYDNFQVLKLPYQQGGDKRQFSMYILLPEARDGLWCLAEKLSSEPEFLDKHIPMRRVPVGQFKVPKFKISFGFEASDLLKGLGLQLPFSPEADLSELVDSPAGQNLRVSSVFHKSFVEVNEEGSEAAAASAVVLMGSSLRMPMRMDFIADHPFLFLIREDTTGVVLFVGHVINPLLITP